MKYIVTINNKRYEVEVEKGQASVLSTTDVVAVTAETGVTAVAKEDARQQTSAAIDGACETINAPMPGAVLDIKVAVGQKVKQGDVVVMLEAMKMENEITTHKDGIVKQISVSKGAYVATNDVLVVIQ